MPEITIKEPIRDVKTHENETKGKDMMTKIYNIFGAIKYPQTKPLLVLEQNTK